MKQSTELVWTTTAETAASLHTAELPTLVSRLPAFANFQLLT